MQEMVVKTGGVEDTLSASAEFNDAVHVTARKLQRNAKTDTLFFTRDL